MSEQLSISSIRVDKPGKSKFAPVIAADRKKAAPSKPVQQEIVEHKKVVDVVEDIDIEPTSSQIVLDTKLTAIQAVQARRAVSQRDKESPNTSKKMTAASLTSAAEVKKRPLAYYLKDTKEGIPMAPTPTAVQAKNSPKRTAPKPKATTSAATKSVSSIVAPQVRVVDGEIVVDEEVSVVAQPLAATEGLEMDIVHDTGRHLTSHAFVKTQGSNRWSESETKKFYDALSMCGTDFSLIAALFPSRTREQIKGKYRVEERNNSRKVETFLKKRKKFGTMILWYLISLTI